MRSAPVPSLLRSLGMHVMVAGLIAAAGVSSAAAADRPDSFERGHVSLSARGQTDLRIHYAGDVWVGVSNDGTIGEGHPKSNPWGSKDRHALRIDWDPGFEFPGGSRVNYLGGCRLLFGCVRGNDTLVSGNGWFDEFLRPSYEWTPQDTIRELSNNPSSLYFDPRAHTEQEYYAVYDDTSIFAYGGLDYVDRRRHLPIGVEVHQTSCASSREFGRRFIIVDNWIVNISGQTIEKGCVGLFVFPSTADEDADAGYYGTTPGFDEDSGLRRWIPGVYPDTKDSMFLAWAADHDGDGGPGGFAPFSHRGAVGVVLLRGPRNARISYNWWSIYGTGTQEGWGPQLRRNEHAYDGAPGPPLGDRSRYHIMTNGEIDYDQVQASIDHSAEGWTRPPAAYPSRGPVSGGAMINFALSYGPLPDIAPGDSVPFTYALVAGENLHTDPQNYMANFDPGAPQRYVNGLDFNDLFERARSASWFFDYPGIDTDRNGYAGRYHIVNCRGIPFGVKCDEVWYLGDGVPDWLGPQAPPGPPFTLMSKPHEVTLRWNGAISETTRNLLSRRLEFEGYRVYSARSNVSDQYTLIASWDIDDNYSRWAYTRAAKSWRQISYPLTVERWRQALNDSLFDPRRYANPSFETAFRDWVGGEERYSYWAREGPNRGNRYWATDHWEDNLIQRVGERDTVVDQDTLAYGIYEFTITNLSSSNPLYFAVTAFTSADYLRNVPSSESSPLSNTQYSVPVYSANIVEDSGLKVSVYPNPYKISFTDAAGHRQSYHSRGYEAPGREMSEYDRRIWFVNLPDSAQIRIYTLDGDLVRELFHPDPALTTYSSMIGWDLISRNTQAVASGIYIYRIDSRLGSQIGKLVIIK